MPKHRDGLSPRRKIFARKYVEKNFNGTQAVLDSPYNVGSKASAKQIASQNLRDPLVQKEIKAVMQEKGMSEDWLIDKMKGAIEYNLDEGKPNQAVGANLLDKALKIYNAYPATKNMSMRISLKEQLPDKNFDEIKSMLKELQAKTASIIDDTK